MIISAGYNIAGPEVESTLLAHASVKECAVCRLTRRDARQIVKAFVVVRETHARGRRLVRELQSS
jgi:2-aminobenzoate-CoA ligase